MASSQVTPAPKDVLPQHVEMKVPLYSFGCEKKVKKAYKNVKGIHSVEVDYELQKVTVWGICNRDDVLALIKKKRREARFWNVEEVEQSGNENEEENASASEITEKICSEGRKNKIRKPWKRLLPISKILP